MKYQSEEYPTHEVFIKEHVSKGQVCAEFETPIHPGQRLNFNFLPVMADRSMSVMPHTVQMYTLEEPTGGTYGNDNFSDIFKIENYSASRGRKTLFFGETAYWVNYDMIVPLWLAPCYIWRAVGDLRQFASSGVELCGTVNFESGWEWCFWLASISQYRASWDPQLATAGSTEEAITLLLAPLDRALGSGWSTSIVKAAKIQRRYLIYGGNEPIYGES